MTNYVVGAMDDNLLVRLVEQSIPTFSMQSGLTTGDFGRAPALPPPARLTCACAAASALPPASTDECELTPLRGHSCVHLSACPQVGNGHVP